MKKYAYIFLSALLSGFCITIGVCVYLSVVQINKIVGSLLFGLGLFGIVHFNLFLYTGKVGNLLDNKPKYILQLIVGILGNIAGAIILASIIKITRIGDNLQNEAMKLIEIKQNDSWYSILNRDSSRIKDMEKEAKHYYKMTFPDKLEQFTNKMEMISTFMDVLR